MNHRDCPEKTNDFAAGAGLGPRRGIPLEVASEIAFFDELGNEAVERSAAARRIFMVRVSGVSCDTHNLLASVYCGVAHAGWRCSTPELDFRMAYEEIQRVLGVIERTYC